MGSRLIPFVLLAVLGMLHAQLWLGRGSIPNVARLQQKIDEQKTRNATAQRLNDRLASEVSDLKEGLEMVEERARMELGMVKPDEIFVQINSK
ncbi:MAG: cell division protein FtsB [Curvibacter sp.]|nr:cell division protein FtsB [Curvibacter sp.]